MRRIALITVIMAAFAGTAAQAAETELERLRDAVRNMTSQLRSFEDQLVHSRTKLAQAEKEKTLAVQAANKLKADLKQTQQEFHDAVDEFNKRLANRDETIEKWKTAYAEAAGVARDKDAQRAKFEEEADTFKARTKSCEARNRKLLRVSGEVLAAYRDLTPLDKAVISEPLIGIAKVDHENKVQCLQDKILDQDARLPASADNEPAKEQKTDQKAGDQKSPGAKNAPAKPGPKKPQASGGSAQTGAPSPSGDSNSSNTQN